MTDYLLILVSTILVNNFVLVQFLGLCPFMGVSGKLETAMGMSLATTFVLTLASVCSYLAYTYLLEPLDLAPFLTSTRTTTSLSRYCTDLARQQAFHWFWYCSPPCVSASPWPMCRLRFAGLRSVW
jgi:hypothetical protein